MDGFLPYPEGFSTHAIRYYQEPDQCTSMAVVTPLVTSTTFKQNGLGSYKKYEYGRSGNPTREILENVLAKLDDAQFGLTFASGLGTITTIIGMLKSGDHVLCDDDVYGGTNRLLNKVASNFGIETTLVDLTNVDNVAKAIKPNTKMVWFESPTNPTLKVIDIKAVADVAHKKDENIIVVVDNTFLTPYLQRPLNFGADIVAYSLTKYMNGHSDVIMGAITTRNDELYNKIQFLQNAMGVVPSPFDCYQVLRSLKTLSVRMRQHSKNAIFIAKFLETHPAVTKVIHPGFPEHPGYSIMQKQTSGHSGIISFYHKGGLEESDLLLKSLQLFTLAESLGGYESLAEVPSIMTHASVPKEQREKLKITDNLIRMSVGLEDAEDLIADLKMGLDKLL